MSSLSRRSLLKTSSVLVCSSLLPSSTAFANGVVNNPELLTRDFIFSVLDRIMNVLDELDIEWYDVSFDKKISQKLSQVRTYTTGGSVSHVEAVNIGVRVRVGDSWGFASTNQYSDHELYQAAHSAYKQARAHRDKSGNSMEWEKYAPVIGSYITEGVDPFSVSLEEKLDFMNSWRTLVIDYKSSEHSAVIEDCEIRYSRVEGGYLNSDGSRLYSINYFSDAHLPLKGSYRGNRQSISSPRALVCKGMHTQQGGWDTIINARPHEQIPDLIAESAASSLIGISPVDIGRYDIVCDGTTTARLIGRSLVRASELDRVMGYEANAGGTSYLGPDPFANLGKPVASDLLTISANTDLDGGIGSTPWDAEGCRRLKFDIVKDGILSDYMTNREMAPVLSEWYSRNGKAAHSNSCSSREDSSKISMISAPNISVMPRRDSGDTAALISEVKKGYYLEDCWNISTSFQCNDGYVVAFGREIHNGKLGNYVRLGVLFDTVELLSNIAHVGDASTLQPTINKSFKGQPSQGLLHTISAPTVHFKDAAVIDPMRKAS